MREVQVTFDCADPARSARFWSEVLGYQMQPPPPVRHVGRRLWTPGVPEEQRNAASAAVSTRERVRPAAVLPAGARGQDREEPRAPRRPRRPGLQGDERMAALEAEAERLVALGATRLERTSPAADRAPATSSCTTPRATSSASTEAALGRLRERTARRRQTPTPPRAWVGVGGRAAGLRARGLPPLLARRGRPRGRRPLRHLRLPAGDVHDAPAAGVRRDADPGRAARATGSAPRSVLLVGTTADRPGAGRLRPRRLLRRRPGRPGLRRHRRRDDLHLRAAAGQQLVPAAPDPAGHPAHRHPRPARRGGRRRTDDLGARPPRLDPRLPDRGRRSGLVAGGGGAACCSHDSPDHRHLRGAAAVGAAVRHSLRASWAQPGTRLGFWMHFTTQFSATMPSLLWGYPFFVTGEGRSPATAGAAADRHGGGDDGAPARSSAGWSAPIPWHRSTMVLGIVGAIVTVWTVVLVWPGDAPLPLLVVLVAGHRRRRPGLDDRLRRRPHLQPGAPAGQRHRDHQPGRLPGQLVLVVAIGVVLDWRTPGGGTRYPPSAFRWAMSLQYVLWALGLVQIYRYRRRTRAKLLRSARERDGQAQSAHQAGDHQATYSTPATPDDHSRPAWLVLGDVSVRPHAGQLGERQGQQLEAQGLQLRRFSARRGLATAARLAGY